MAAEPGVRATFYKHPVLNANKSREAGRQVFEEKHYIHITIAGQDKQDTRRPIQEADKVRFPDEWARYERGQEQCRTGTPVNQWPELTPSQVRMLENLNIWTVEDMASLSDAGLAEVGMGARSLQERARKFLSLAQSAADLAKLDELEQRLAARDVEVAQLKQQMAELLLRLPVPAVASEKAEEAPEPVAKRRKSQPDQPAAE